MRVLLEREQQERASGQSDAANAIAGELEAAEVRYKQAREQYRNVVDRLCFAVRGGALPESIVRAEYEPLLDEIVGTFSTEFGAESPFTNIRTLRSDWKSPALTGMTRWWPRHRRAANDLERVPT